MTALKLRGGVVVDGTGAAPVPGGLVVDDGRIVHVGDVDGVPVDQEVDVDGAVIAPGFIDIHSHSDFVLPLVDQEGFLEPFARQGITTLVTGNCGYAPAPVAADTAHLLQGYTQFIKPRDLEWRWRTFGEFLDVIDAGGVFLNVVPLAAHGAMRIAAMGFEARPADAGELRAMQGMVGESLDAGAFGLSCGLIYAPGMFADTNELIELARPVAARDGIFTAHVRGSSETLVHAADELIQIGRDAGVRVQHSHLEAFGRRFWPQIDAVLARHDSARAGQDHGFDVIPYTAANTTFLAIMPPWALAGGVPALLERLADPSVSRRIERDIAGVVPEWPTWRPGGWPHNLVAATGWEHIAIMWVASEANESCEGVTLARLAERDGCSPFEVARRLILEERGQVTALYLGVSGMDGEEEALRQVLAHPSASIETDAFSLGRGKPHPALVGTFPRVLGRYVREERLLKLEEAVRRMTSLSADRVGLRDRGRLATGMAADVTVFDADRIGDRATFAEPDVAPTGIRLVLINGHIVVDGDRVDTTRRAGSVCRR